MATVWLLVLYALLIGAAIGASRCVDRSIRLGDLAVFSLLPLIFISPGLFSDKTPVPTDHLAHCTPWRSSPASSPYNSSLSDVASQFAPWAKAVRVAWKERSFPWRDRWNGCGTPLAANGQSSAFSPLTFLMFLLPLSRAFTLLGASKLLLAMIGMHLWLSEIGLSRRSARFGAVVFGLSFAFTPWLYHPASAGLALWPWVLFATDYRHARFGNRSWWLLVVALAVWPLCGHTETIALESLFILLWLALRALARESGIRERVARLAAAGVLAAGLSSFLLIPETVAILASNRLALARDPNHLSYVPWVPYRPGWLGAFWTSLFPRTFGDGIASPMMTGAAGSIVEMGFGYIGLVGWACALTIRSKRASGAKQDALVLILLLGLGGAMGLPPFRSLFELLPGMGLAPPLRLLLFVSLSAAALAAFGFEHVFEGEKNLEFGRTARSLLLRLVSLGGLAIAIFMARRSLYEASGALTEERHILFENVAVVLAASVVCMVAARRRRISSAVPATFLTAIAAVQLLHEGMRLYRFSSPESFYPPTPLLAFLRAQPGPYRVLGDDLAVFPNTNVFAGVEEIRTHDPAERRDYVLFLDRTCGYLPSEYAKTVRDVNAPVLDFLNVRYLITDPGRASPGPKWIRVYAGSDGTVFENTRVQPRFFAPPRVEVLASFSSKAAPLGNALDAFGAPLNAFLAVGEFDQRALVLASGDGALRVGLLRQEDRIVRVTPVAETTNRIVFDAEVGGGPAVLVSSLVQDGGWTARDKNGRQLVTSWANGPFLTLVVPSGRSRISMRYLPPGLASGAAITGGSVLVGVILLVRERRRRAV